MLHAETKALAGQLTDLLDEERASAADEADGLRRLLAETSSKLLSKLDTMDVDLEGSQARRCARASQTKR